MLRHRHIDRVCCIVLALTLFLSVVFVSAAALGLISEENTMGYETRLFNQSRVHTMDIVMEDWETFLSTCTSEEYAACDVIIDGEQYKNVAIRGKGNTSLSSVAAYGNNRYSFKVEFDHYQTGYTYHGLDKLSLNNLIQDNTYMKDYFAYTLMNQMGVASPLCSFVEIRVNGEPWGLYLAVEGVEDAFLQRNYGKNHGELYKPDSMSFGGGRGNGRDFNMDEMAEQFGFSFGEGEANGFSGMPAMGGMPVWGEKPDMPDWGQMPQEFDPGQLFGGNISESTEEPETPASDQNADIASGSGADADRSGGRSKGNFGDRVGGFGSSTDVKLQYAGDDPADYANIFNNAKTEITSADQERLIASLKTLSEGDVSVVDTDQVIRYMAVHNFLCNDDSYTGTMVHNYYLYEEEGVMAMIPWDYNLAYGGFSGGNATSTVNTDITRLVSSGLTGDRPMADWITASEEYSAQYLKAYGEFIAQVFESDWFEKEIDRVAEMIDPYVKEDPTAFCTYEEFQAAAETLKSFCLKRAESVINQLNGDSTRVDASELDLSVMGTMGGRGGQDGFGSFERPDGNADNRPGGEFAGGMGGGFGNSDMPQGGFGGFAPGGEMPAGMNGGMVPPFGGQMPTEPKQVPEQTTIPDAVQENEGKQNERNRGISPATADVQSSSRWNMPDSGGWIPLSAALLLMAVLGICLIRNKR